MTFDEEISNLISNRVAKLRSHEAKNYMLANPLYPTQQKKSDIEQINEKLVPLRVIHAELTDRVKKLKELVPDITEQSTSCAIYLLYGKVLQTWDSIFLLASRGHGFDTMEFRRSIGENLDLIHTFYLDESGELLKRWFDGEIISHKVSREIESEFLKKGKIKEVDEGKLSPQQMAVDIYRGFSQYTHRSYLALLDCVDPFNEDFDWSLNAGAHWILNNMHALENAMVTTLIALKMTYRALKDDTSYAEIDKILVDFAGPMNEKTLKDLVSKSDKLA